MTKLVAENYADYRQAVRDEELNVMRAAGSEKPMAIVGKRLPSSDKLDTRQIIFNEVKELQRMGFKPTTIAICPQSAYLYYNRGLVYLRKKETEKAVADLSKAGERGLYKAYGIIKKYGQK